MCLQVRPIFTGQGHISKVTVIAEASEGASWAGLRVGRREGRGRRTSSYPFMLQVEREAQLEQMQRAVDAAAAALLAEEGTRRAALRAAATGAAPRRARPPRPPLVVANGERRQRRAPPRAPLLGGRHPPPSRAARSDASAPTRHS